jgi:hypothetical protein
MPLLQSLRLTEDLAAKAAEMEEVVLDMQDTLSISMPGVGGIDIPSLDQVMSGNDISFEREGYEKTMGSMVIPSVLDAITGPAYESELIPVEINEIIYTDVADVWAAVDEYGRRLSSDYDFYVTFNPQDYSNYGDDYRFCELTKPFDEGTVYVACIYSRTDSKIIMHFGYIWARVSENGIGPLNLEKIAEEGR